MHSWRVLLLPFVDGSRLYEEYRFDEPWNGPNNRKLAKEIPNVYRCPSYHHHLEHHGSETHDSQYVTNYVAVSGPGTVFDGTRATSLNDITDGPSSTLLIADVSRQAVHWMEPVDVPAGEIFSYMAYADDEDDLNHDGGAVFAFADGSVRFIHQDIDRSILDALATINGGEDVNDF